MPSNTEIIQAELARIDALIAPLERERATILRLAQKLNGAAPEPAATPTPESSQRGALRRLVLQIITAAGRDGIGLDAIETAVNAQRPTNRGSVQATLAYLKRRGELRRTSAGLWRTN